MEQQATMFHGAPIQEAIFHIDCEPALKEATNFPEPKPLIEPVADKINNFRWLCICVALYTSVLIYGLDTTIAADMQVAVTNTFGAVNQLAWLGAGFPLGSVASILPFGALYTKFNLKWLFVSGMVLFQTGSAVCGSAPSMSVLIVGRVFAGLGGTGVYLGCLNFFSVLTAPERRGAYISGIAFIWGIGAVLGPAIGGGFSISNATWRWGFYINLIIGGLCAPVYVFALPSLYPLMGIPLKERILALDFIGFILSAAAWVLFTMAFISAGSLWSWNDGRTIASLIVFGVLTLAYIAQQSLCIFTTRSTRSFPGHIFRTGVQILLAIGTASVITSLYIPVYYIPIYFQFVESDTPLKSAVRLLPFVLIAVFVNLFSGFLLTRVKYYKLVYFISGALIILGGALFYKYLDPSVNAGTIYGISIVTAAGTGLTLQIGYTIASLKVTGEDVGNVISLQNLAQIGGTTCALVIAGQVFQSSAIRNLTRVLADLGFSSADIRNAVAGSQSKLFSELEGHTKEQALLAVTQAIQQSFILVIAAGGLLVGVGILMPMEQLFL
jgi:MFS family permease